MQKAIPPSSSFVQMTELVLPNHMNALGTIFGGVIMSWIDIAASISAGKHCSKNVVTASIDDVHFLAPVHKGDVVHIRAQVNCTHKTSMEVAVQVMAENIKTKEVRQTANAYLTFVALDDKGKPSPVPPLLLTTEKEKTQFRQGQERRKWRLERKKQINSQ